MRKRKVKKECKSCGGLFFNLHNGECGKCEMKALHSQKKKKSKERKCALCYGELEPHAHFFCKSCRELREEEQKRYCPSDNKKALKGVIESKPFFVDGESYWSY